MPPMPRNLRKHCLWSLAWEIRNTAARLDRCRALICETVGLSSERWSALAVLCRSTHLLSISDLARQLRRSRQSAHSLALGLERDGWIRFLPNPDDRRLIQMELTNPGRRILADIEHRYNTCLLVMWYDLDMRELLELRKTLRVIRDHIARARDLM
jgi:DNA-binding MarR family transcriptional regulator